LISPAVDATPSTIVVIQEWVCARRTTTYLRGVAGRITCPTMSLVGLQVNTIASVAIFQGLVFTEATAIEAMGLGGTHSITAATVLVSKADVDAGTTAVPGVRRALTD